MLTIAIYRYILLSMDINEVAERCGKSSNTVRRWCKKENLPYKKKGLQGIIDISEEDLKDFCEEHGIEELLTNEQ